MEENSSFYLIIFTLLFLVVINLFILNLKVFSPASLQFAEIAITITPTAFPTQSFLLTPPSQSIKDATHSSSSSFAANDSSCPSACLSLLQERYASSNSKVVTQAKEYYIPLGGGSSNKSEWEDLVTTETLVDPANYGLIKEAYFIATLRNPTQNGQVEAQLYNVTDKHPVWGSHIVMHGPKEQTIVSEKIIFSQGAKLYRVQLKSTLSYQVFLENARIRIISE